MSSKLTVAILFVAALAGCQTTPSSTAKSETEENTVVAEKQPAVKPEAKPASKPVAKAAAAPVAAPGPNACTTYGQANCLEVVALNGVFVPGKHDHYKGAVSWEQQMKRAPGFWQAYHKGSEKAAKGKDIDVTIYSAAPINIADISVWRANGRTHQVTKMEVVDVTNQVQLPKSDRPLGIATVIRIRAEGSEAFVASIKLPNAMVAGINYMTVCSAGKDTVVPNRITANQSYGISKESLRWMVEQGWKRLPLIFLSPDS